MIIVWKIYADYLRKTVNNYNMVFAADVRDTIFQADLFKFYENSEEFLGIALEDAALTEPCNKNWLIQRYGNDLYESIKENHIICTGTIWGTARQFMEFTSIISEHINSKDYPYYRICDQASGNWLIYHKKMFSDILSPSANNDCLVMTIGHTDAKALHIDPSGNVLNSKGQIVAVVHQYDRKPAIIDIVVKKYCAGMSAFSKAKLKHNCDGLGRVMRFMSRVHRKGIFRSVLEAVKRRI